VSRNFIATLYDRFTEGFDTQDLKDAKVLLEELSRAPHPHGPHSTANARSDDRPEPEGFRAATW
jgi:hypothetical protein